MKYVLVGLLLGLTLGIAQADPARKPITLTDPRPPADFKCPPELSPTYYPACVAADWTADRTPGCYICIAAQAPPGSGNSAGAPSPTPQPAHAPKKASR